MKSKRRNKPKKATNQLQMLLTRANEAVRSGKPAEAEQVYRKILRHDTDNLAALHGLALLAQEAGRSDVAVQCLKRTTALAPNNPMFHSHLGVVYRTMGQLDDSIASHRRAFALAPNEAPVRNNLGNALRDAKQFEEAVEHFRVARKLAPNYPEANRNLGITLRDLGQKEEAQKYLEEAVRLRPLYCEAQNDLGGIYREQERDEEAEACFRTAIKANPNYAPSYLNLAGTMQRQGKTELPPKLYRKAVELDPDLPEAYLGLGSTYEQEGLIEEAVVQFRKALSVKPELGNGYLSLASIPSVTLTEEERAQIQNLLAKPDLEDETRSALYFALARVCEREKKYDQAFEYVQKGNKIDRAKIDFSAQANRQFISRCIEIFDKPFLEARADFGSESDRPVFVLGLPRSGTTLIEQIISAHPKAFGGGEVVLIHNMARQLTRELNSKVPYPDCIFDMTAESSKRLAGLYLDHLASFDNTALRVTDKLPFNFRYVGLLQLLFPKARIIHCRRDPRDVAVSCYFIKFLKPISFAYDLTDFGEYYRDYVRVMDHWRRVLPKPMLEINYEDVIADQEGKSREIIEFCGLDWDDACLTFHEAERPVHTASSWQVRQPIYSSSVQRWRRYEAHLGPLITALGDSLPAEQGETAQEPASL